MEQTDAYQPLRSADRTHSRCRDALDHMDLPMTLSPFDLAVSYAIVVAMPVIIWANYRTRDVGLMGHLWRETPVLALASLIFLSLITLFSAIELLTHYGFLSAEIEDTLSVT